MKNNKSILLYSIEDPELEELYKRDYRRRRNGADGGEDGALIISCLFVKTRQ